MKEAKLYDYQEDAVSKMRPGCILCGGVGTGKSRTALSYYERYFGGRDLYIMSTAKKRDSGEWKDECAPFGIRPKAIDSWNNIHKYVDAEKAFFIFDEQRVSGSGAWVKAFLKIAKKNVWILLSATPGDTWSDYIPVFIANGFYRNRTEFNRQHVIFNHFANYPKIDGYRERGLLVKHRNQILVTMDAHKEAIQHHNDIPVSYDKNLYKTVWRDRWDPYDNCPIQETGKLGYLLRKVVNEDTSRIAMFTTLLLNNPKAIVFYNYQYECDLIQSVCNDIHRTFAEWNGQKHEELPEGDEWCYAVQYAAGCEGWNCITTNVLIFYSQSYSYRQTIQAAGRIDRLNTPFKDLEYYHLKSNAPIDIAIAAALKQKRNFNENAFTSKRFSR